MVHYPPVYSLGYASDGGLYFPDTIHKLSEEEISHWSNLEYIDLVKVTYFQDFFISMDYLIRFYTPQHCDFLLLHWQEILSLYISEEEIPRQDLNELVEKSFGDKFDVPEASLCRKTGNQFLNCRWGDNN